MMQRYFNKHQKTTITLLLACQQFLQQAVENGESYIPSEVLGDLKRSRSFAKRSMDSWLESLDDKTAKSIVNMIRDYEITIQTNMQAAKDPARREQQAFLSGAEYVQRMAEASMEAKCASCDGSCRDACPLYESYVHFEVPEYDPNHALCPYAMKEVSA